MYDENDLSKAAAAAKRARILMLAPAGLLIALAIWTFVVRIKWLTILLTALAGCWMIFVYHMKLVPQRAYQEHIRSALRAPKKEAEGRYLRMEATPVERNNVMYYAFYLNVGEKLDPEDDRLFYYDALKPLPDWRDGDRLHVTSYDKFVSSCQVVSRADAAGSPEVSHA